MTPMTEPLKLMCDYDCWPLWRPGGENVDPSDLPVSDSLRERLVAWSDTYDAILNRDSPADSAFPSPSAEAAWEAEGRELWAALQAELGDGYAVSYYSRRDRRVLEPLDRSL